MCLRWALKPRPPRPVTVLWWKWAWPHLCCFLFLMAHFHASFSLAASGELAPDWPGDCTSPSWLAAGVNLLQDFFLRFSKSSHFCQNLLFLYKRTEARCHLHHCPSGWCQTDSSLVGAEHELFSEIPVGPFPRRMDRRWVISCINNPFFLLLIHFVFPLSAHLSASDSFWCKNFSSDRARRSLSRPLGGAVVATQTRK